MSSGRPEGTRSESAAGACGYTHAGARESNEDAILITELPDDCGMLMAVADGLGGHAAGEVASSIALEVLLESLWGGISPDMNGDDLSLLLEKGFTAANDAVVRVATGERAGMGTTLVAVIVRDGQAVFGNTGDSRGYIFSKPGAGMMEVRFRTKDHSEVQKMVDQGLIDRETARTHPMRNVVTHSVGGKFDVDTYEIEVNDGDVIVLSSDGLHDYLTEEEMGSCITSSDAEKIASCLFEMGLGVTWDNISVIVKVC